MDLYTLVDLSTVWALGEVYESDLSLVKIGQMAEVELPYSVNKPLVVGSELKSNNTDAACVFSAATRAALPRTEDNTFGMEYLFIGLWILVTRV